jgi:hypothetical protein
MIAEMTSYYSELQDHDGPPSRTMMNSVGRTSIDRKSTMSELSLDLDDLEDMRLHRTPSNVRGSNDNAVSGPPLPSWAHEPETTTGNVMVGRSSLGGFLQQCSLDRVIEDSDEEFPSSSIFRTDGIWEDKSNRLRHFSKDDTPLARHCLQEESSSMLSCFGRSQSWDGTPSGTLSKLNLGGYDEKKPGKRVHFEVPARLEEIQEFDKPDVEDFDKLYYMAHEIQKMMDEFRQESELNRHILR